MPTDHNGNCKLGERKCLEELECYDHIKLPGKDSHFYIFQHIKPSFFKVLFNSLENRIRSPLTVNAGDAFAEVTAIAVSTEYKRW